MRRLMLASALAAVAISGFTSTDAVASCGNATAYDVGDRTIYIDERPSQDFIPVSSYGVYLESNGIDGLQRGGSWPEPLNENHYDTCNDGGEPDTLII